MVGVACVGLDSGDDGGGADEARDVVHVAVCVVAGNAAAEPDDLIDAEIVVKGVFELLAADAGVALLDFAEQALLRGEQNASAVGVNGAAFKHDAVLRAVLVLDEGLPGREVEQRGHAAGELVVELAVRILGPAVEEPVGEAYLALCVAYKDGTGVARPTAVCRPPVKADAGQIGPCAPEDTGYALFGFLVFDGNVDLLVASKQAHDLRIEPGDGLEFSGPVLGVVGPGEPCGLVPIPLGGHAVAECLRCVRLRDRRLGHGSISSDFGVGIASTGSR